SSHAEVSLPVLTRYPPTSTLFPYTTLFRSNSRASASVKTAVLNPMPIASDAMATMVNPGLRSSQRSAKRTSAATDSIKAADYRRSEEHTSELQSPDHLVCRLLLEKKKQKPL